MLVVLTQEHRRGSLKLFPGTLLDLPADEAMVLVQDGVAVPAPRDETQAEHR